MSEVDPSILASKHHPGTKQPDTLTETSGRVQNALDNSLSKAEEQKKQLYAQRIVALLAD